MLDRLRQAKRVVLSVLVDNVAVLADRIAHDPSLERRLAKEGVVPQRCGLCKHFNKEDYARAAAQNPAYVMASSFLDPTKMAGVNTGPLPEAPEDPLDELPEPPPAPSPYGAHPSRASDAAHKLRPTLTESFQDYGVCHYYKQGLWAFEEHPAMPDPGDKPCEKWS